MAKSRSITNKPTSTQGLTIERRFTRPGVHPFDEVEWELRTATITNEKGEVVFEQKDVEIPKAWSQMATNVVVSKYFRGQIGKPERERSVKQLIGRVVDTISGWGRDQGYFASPDDAEAFEHELAYLLVTQRMAFNSPVWFNVGVEERPQGSACFINSIEDTMESILGLAKTEGMLFKYGSGAGVNLSPLRGSMERLKHGGTASGPVSFMKGFDAFAGAIKSGGATRRAAKMVILNVDHPDIEEFINCKVNEEKKAWALIDAGYDGAYTGEAYGSVFFQNSNNSVRVPDEFMKAVENDGEWTTKMVTDGSAHRNYKARDLMRQISDAAWICGDPGMQYDTIIQDWNCVANTARINATNPCSEFVFIDDTACNLASLNLMKFLGDDGNFLIDDFRHAVRITITAQEMIVPNASYPTPKIEENSHKLRPLGLGYANLGALLMVARPALRLRRGSRLRRRGDLADDGRGLRAVGAHRRHQRRAVRALRAQPRADAARHEQAQGRVLRHRPQGRRRQAHRRRLQVVGRGGGAGHEARLPQRPGHGAGAHRHDRFHDGLRHHRRRARHRPGQVQEAGRRRAAEDRQQHRAAGPEEARLRRGRGQDDHRLHRRERHHRGRARRSRTSTCRSSTAPSRPTRASARSTTWGT